MLTATFCDPSPPDFGGSCFCKNPNAMATIAHCYTVAHSEEIDSFIQICEDDYGINVTREQFEESWINYNKFSRSIQDIENYDRSTIVQVPIKLNDSDIFLFKDAYEQFLGNYDRSIYYGGILVSYWLLVFMLASIGNWAKLILPDFCKNLTGPLTNWFRKSISLPATTGQHKTNKKLFLKVIDMLVPTRAETLIVTVFLILTLRLLSYRIHSIEDDPIFASKKSALLRYVAVRSSIISSAMIPLLILFGGRNNFLLWLTRWDYSTFITLHRWSSRIIFFIVVIHATCYSFYLSSYREEMKQSYLIWGTIATIAGGIIMVQSMLYLRRNWYEIFLLAHIIMAALFIAGSWIHVEELGYVWFFYAAVAVWVFDRIVRIGRLLSFGFPKANVSILADETIKVIVPKPKHWHPIPGGHVFIHFLRPSCFWQSHPFTYTTSVNSSDQICLYIKVKDGITSTLYNDLLTQPGKCMNIRVAIEGPYGEITPASRYDTAVFIAGGSGIPGIYAEAYDMAKNKTDLKQSIKLIWIIREYSSLYWFYRELLSLQNTNIETTIYISRPHQASRLYDIDERVPSDYLSIGSESNEDVPNKHLLSNAYDERTSSTKLDCNRRDSIVAASKAGLLHIVFKEGRPSIDSIVVQNIKESMGSTCFVACGHPVLVDDVRAAVVHNISNEDGNRVDYFEQLQVWA